MLGFSSFKKKSLLAWTIKICVALAVLSVIMAVFVLSNSNTTTQHADELIVGIKKKQEAPHFVGTPHERNPEREKKASVKQQPYISSASKETLKAVIQTNTTKLKLINEAHMFYYPWFKSLKFDGNYSHWNHELMPGPGQDGKIRRRVHVPPDDIGANFYPKLGPYSSLDPAVIDTHMRQMAFTQAGVVAVSWYPPHYERTKEIPVDAMMRSLFDAAAKYGLKITFHIEPYTNRSGQTLEKVTKYIIDTYGKHPAFYRSTYKNQSLPLFYIYDSYQIKPKLWAEALKKGGPYSIRDTKYDAIFLGLLVEHTHMKHIADSGFDGFYTYFATNGFSYGSTWRNWPVLATKAKKQNLIFVPSVGPGYIDTQVRPWNAVNTRRRLNGQYYKNSFKAALKVKPSFLSITSFNEWHEGTQVEPAIPKAIKNFKYLDYLPNKPGYYLNLTRYYVGQYHNATKQGGFVHLHDDSF